MIQHRTFNSTKGYVLHKVTGPYSGTCSAWFDADGTLKDAEQYIRNGTTRPVRQGAAMWEHLQMVGRRYVSITAELVNRTNVEEAVRPPCPCGKHGRTLHDGHACQP